MSRLLSYIYPITKKVHSEFSGILEITWYNGKKHLNTKNANYSYGSLQKILKFGLEKIDLNNINSILLLGLGGGSVIETLRKDFNYSKEIMAVDIDPVIIEIAKNEFNLIEDENLKIVCEDALLFMNSNTRQFDLIIIDLFVDIKVPKPFLEIPFWQDIVDASHSKGTFLFNASLQKTKNDELNTIIDFLKTHTNQIEVFEKVNTTNTLILTKGQTAFQNE